MGTPAQPIAITPEADVALARVESIGARQTAGLPRRLAAFATDAIACALAVLAAGTAVSWLPREAAAAVTSVVGLAYFTVAWTRFGATPGQRILGLQVRASDGASRLGFGRAALRWALLGGPLWIAYTSVPGLVGLVCLGTSVVWACRVVLSAALDPAARGLHDRLAGSRVIRVSAALDPTTRGLHDQLAGSRVIRSRSVLVR